MDSITKVGKFRDGDKRHLKGENNFWAEKRKKRVNVAPS